MEPLTYPACRCRHDRHEHGLPSGRCERRACGCGSYHPRDDAPQSSPRRAPHPIQPDRRGTPITRTDPSEEQKP